MEPATSTELVIVTVTPGTTAPWSSTARTRMLPVCTCASAGAAIDRTNAAAKNLRIRLIAEPPEKELGFVASSGRSLSRLATLTNGRTSDHRLFAVFRRFDRLFEILDSRCPRCDSMGHFSGYTDDAMKSLLAAVLAVSAALIAHAAGGLTIDQLIDIRHPSSPMWAPDGRHVVFIWERAGVAAIHVADAPISAAAATATPPTRELAGAGGSLNGAFWSTDGRALMVPRNGDLWRVPIDGSAATAVWTTTTPET